MAVSEAIPYKLLFLSQDAELIAIQITLPTPIVVVGIYIPPQSPLPLISTITQHIHDLCLNCGHIIILGDFNHPLIDWSSLSGNSESGILIRM